MNTLINLRSRFRKMKLWLVILFVVIILTLISRQLFLSNALQDPKQYRPKLFIEKDHLIRKNYGSLSINLPSLVDFIEINQGNHDSIHRDKHPKNEVWILDHKPMSIYAQYSDYAFPNGQPKPDLTSMAKNALYVWERAFELNLINERFYTQNDRLRVECTYSNKVETVSVLCTLIHQKYSSKLIMIKGPVYQLSLLDTIMSSTSFRDDK